MKRWKWLGLFAVFAIVVAACSPSADETTTTEGSGATSTTGAGATTTTGEPAMAGQGGELLLLRWQGPSQANPYLSTGTKDLLAGSLVLEPMAEIGVDGSVMPALAAEIPSKDNGGIAEDDTSVTWHLQEGLTWSDGTPVTSADAVFTWEYCVDELTGCTQDFTTVESVEAVDDLTFTVNWTVPQPYPFGTFVTYQQPIIQKAQFEACKGDAAKSCTEQNFAPVGTGPYMVTDLKPEDTVTYAYNPNYRGAAEGKPFFGTITIKGGGDAEASARSVLEIGEADYGWNLQVAPEIIGPMEDAGKGVVKVAFTSNVEHINLNQTDPDSNPPSDYMDGANPNPFFFKNGQLARALSMAINRDELVQVGYGPSGTPTCTLWGVGAEASHTDDWCLTQDVDGANAILDDLGYMDTDNDGVRELPDGTPLEWDYVTSTNAVRQSNQALIEGYWAQIGVKANMKNEDAGLFFDGTNASDASIWKFFTDIEMFTNGASSPDATGYMAGYKTSEIPESTNNWGGGNIPRYSSDEYDATWLELSQTALDDPARVDLIKKLQDLLIADGVVIPLIYRGNVSAFANSIQGVGDLNGWDSEYWNIEDWTRSS